MEEVDEGVLRGVEGVVGGAGVAVGDAEDEVAVAEVEGLEGGGVAAGLVSAETLC